MASNKKGIQTKEYIYKITKNLFYEFGYNKTTLSLISKEADVPIGLIPYHFKNKDNILKMVYDDFLREIDKCINKHSIDTKNNSILRHAIVSRIYYQIILENNNNKRVYTEVLRKKSNYILLHNSIGSRYVSYLDDYNITLTKEEFESNLYCDFGARREFFLHLMNEDIQMPIQDVVTFVNGIIPRLLKIDQNTVDDILSYSLECFNKIDYSDITFLK
ncbi:MAG: TetR/AcrR family transcriptional regulator [Eubacteriaceae bacterium]